MEIGDKNTTPFENVGDVEYIGKLQTIDTTVNKWIDEALLAQDGEADLADRLAADIASALTTFVALSGLAANFSAGGFRITGAADGIASSDLATVQQVAAGGAPGDIPITSLGNGTASNGQEVAIDSSGNVVGKDITNAISFYLRTA